MLEILKIKPAACLRIRYFFNCFSNLVVTKEWMVKGIYESRAKDYANPFRQMVYESQQRKWRKLKWQRLNDYRVPFANSKKDSSLSIKKGFKYSQIL